ncbi:alcohol dehydrogenase catalytic domain-containing protein [Streptomyces violarus]|uniref:alcohol dehydrogenase catalytic domain-containing protein n=1 Tax=Streptomyces violarus TaxID=67380 RepID=UPI0028F70228|nr:alcohol dehydrogenase catalytic domain-containing protein [Streptomyces violarus]
MRAWLVERPGPVEEGSLRPVEKPVPVGVAWLRRADGDCAYCARGAENLCPRSEYTGRYADGGYAEYTTVHAAFAYPPVERRTTNWRRAAEGAAV